MSAKKAEVKKSTKKKRISPNIILESTIGDNKMDSHDQQKQINKRQMIEEQKSQFISQNSLKDQEPKDFVNSLGNNELELQEMAQRIEQIQLLIDEKIDEVYIEQLLKDHSTMTVDQFVTLFEENMAIQKQESAESTKVYNQQDDIIIDTYIYSNRLCKPEINFKLEIQIVYPPDNAKNKLKIQGSKSKQRKPKSKSKSKQKQQEEESDSESDEEELNQNNFLGTNQYILCEQSNTIEIEESHIKVNQIKQLVKEGFRFDVLKTIKNPQAVDVYNGMAEVLVDLIIDHLPAESEE